MEQYNTQEGYVSESITKSGINGLTRTPLKSVFPIKKGLTAVILVILGLTTITAVATATTIYVPDDGNQTIQQAVNNATEGNTIIVRDGIYTENVDVPTAHLTIRSENGSSMVTVKASESSDHVFHVKANYVKITGFTVKDAYAQHPYAGIYLDGVNHCDILNNNAENNFHGIYLYSSSDNIISGNTANWNEYCGIYLYDSEYNTVSSNTAWGNGQGISLFSSSTNTISGNNASNNYYGGISLDSSNGNTISGNTAMKSYYYGISLESSNDNVIYNNYFSNEENGMINAVDYETNSWNISKTLGSNIIGGPYIGGNYWSDYEGIDSDNDGLGDTLVPYNSLGNIESGGDWLPLVPDTTLPAITNVTATSITMDSATISWDTDEPSDTLVKYGTEAESYPLTASDATAVTSHRITLIGLLADTTYYYVVKSTDQNKNSVESSEYSFTTLADPKIRANVVIKPETLNLKSKGEFTAFITLPDSYNIMDIDSSTVVCEGAPALRGMVADDNKYIVKFDREDLKEDLPTSDELEIIVTGELFDGTPFEGSYTIRVIDQGKGK